MFDAMYDAEGSTRRHYEGLAQWRSSMPAEVLAEKRREADLLFHRVGPTFALHGDHEGTERLIPIDTIPRLIPETEWEHLCNGLKQRVTALNRSLHDIYHDHDTLCAGVIPAEHVLTHDA